MTSAVTPSTNAEAGGEIGRRPDDKRPANSADEKAKRFLFQTVAIAVFVLPAIWFFDLLADFLGPHRWLLVFLVVSGTVAGLIISAIFAGTMFDDDESTEDDLGDEF
jgi:hypothetical protein